MCIRFTRTGVAMLLGWWAAPAMAQTAGPSLEQWRGKLAATKVNLTHYPARGSIDGPREAVLTSGESGG